MEAVKQRLQQVTNLFYIIEEGVALQHEQSRIDGVPVTVEGFGGKCSSAYRELEDYVDQMPTTPLWGTTGLE